MKCNFMFIHRLSAKRRPGGTLCFVCPVDNSKTLHAAGVISCDGRFSDLFNIRRFPQ
jgi:hypothetical protein